MWEMVFQAPKNKNPWGMPPNFPKQLAHSALDQLSFQYIMHEKCMLHLSINYKWQWYIFIVKDTCTWIYFLPLNCGGNGLEKIYNKNIYIAPNPLIVHGALH